MKSGILSFNKGLFSQHARSVLWISVFFLLSQIILLPLGMLVVRREEWGIQSILETNPDNVLLTISFSVQYVTYLIFPVLAGIILTSYMTKKGSSDFMHSLPFKRESLLTHVYAAGAASLVLPIVINAAIVLIMRPFVHPISYTIGDIAEWAGLSAFIVLFLFIVTVLIGLFIGPAILQGVMAYGIFIIPAILVVLTLTNARYFVNGLAVDSYTTKIMEEGIFFIRAGAYEAKPFTGTEWLVYIALAAAAVAISYYVYKVRPAEAVDETIVFPFFRWAFIFVLTFGAMMIGGLYFAELLGGTSAWMITGYVIGALAGYTLLQMIVQKSLRLIWPWKGFALFAALMVVLLIPGMLFAKSYENAVPDSTDITKVYVGESNEPFENEFYMEEQKALLQPDAGFMTGADSIKQVRSMHSRLIGMDNGLGLMEAYPVTIIYELSDGSVLRRQYNVDMDSVADAAGELRSNPEFIKASSSLFALKSWDAFKYLTVQNEAFGSSPVANVADEKTALRLINAMKQDVLSRNTQVLSRDFYSSAGWVEATVGDNMNQLNISQAINLSDEQTIKVIRESVPNGQTFASADMVEEAYIVQTPDRASVQQLTDFIWSGEEEVDLSKIPIDSRKVADKEELTALMNPAGLTTEAGSRMLVLKWKGNPGFETTTIASLKE